MTTSSQLQKDLMERVYKASGFVVNVIQDPSLTVCSTMRSARPGQPGHFILINPQFSDQIEYWVALHCIQLLRMWMVPYEDQKDFRPLFSKEMEFCAEMSKHTFYVRQPREVVDTMSKRLFTGILLQLRSIPCDLRANNILANEFPNLKLQQQTAIKNILRSNSQTLAQEIRKITPTDVYEANVAMNAAYALFWGGGGWEDSSITLPYEVGGFLTKGRKLLTEYKAIPEQGGIEDPKIIDAWADMLNLRSWYEWTLKTP